MRSSLQYVRAVPALAALMENADHLDSMAFCSRRNFNEFIIRMMTYEPTWLKQLYRLRGVLARMMGLQHDELIQTRTPAEYDYSPGGKVSFFTSVASCPGRYWVGEASDKHLSGYISVVAEPVADGKNRYHVMTIVKYNHWTGPIYFNLIKPFHYLIVHYMGKYAGS